MLVLCVGFLQLERDWPSPVEVIVLALSEVELVVVSYAALLEDDQLIVRPGDRTTQFVVRRRDISLQVRPGLIDCIFFQRGSFFAMRGEVREPLGTPACAGGAVRAAARLFSLAVASLSWFCSWLIVAVMSA